MFQWFRLWLFTAMHLPIDYEVPAGRDYDSSFSKRFLRLYVSIYLPEEVAKVFPQSGQAWARAPTCWERMCRCRLLGSALPLVPSVALPTRLGRREIL